MCSFSSSVVCARSTVLPRDKLSAQVKFQDVANAATRSDGVGEFYTFIRIIRKRITVERCEAAFDRFLVRSTSTCRSTVRSEIFDMDAVHERSKRYARPYHLVAACSVAVRQNGEPLASCSDSRFSSRLYAVRILSEEQYGGTRVRFADGEINMHRTWKALYPQ